MTPANDLQEYVDSFFIFPCCDLSDSLAYNDGTPMLAFLSEAEDEVELEYNEAISRFKSGWFSTKSFEKMAVRFSGKGTYLLIVRLNLHLFTVCLDWMPKNSIPVLWEFAIRIS